MNTILALIIAVGAMFGSPQPATAPAQATVTESQVSAPLTWEDAPEYMEAPAPATTTGVEWIDRELAQTDIIIPANIHFILQNGELNCGAQGITAQGGCTHWLEDGSVLIVMSPELVDTPAGKHILFHEIGHAMLTTSDECMAEYYAMTYAEMANWAYAECHG